MRRAPKSGKEAGGASGMASSWETALAARALERYHWRSVTAKLGSLARRAAAERGLPLDPNAAQGVEIWLDRLAEWNARIDLTAARSEEELVDLMLADALEIAPRMPQGARVVDVGSGAGAPGLALALLRPDLRMTLVEPLGKRASFLRTVVGALGDPAAGAAAAAGVPAPRRSIAVERVRGEALAGRKAWDVAISRATLAAPTWLDLSITLVAPGGEVWVLLAKEPAPSHARAVLEKEYDYTWPLTGAARKAVSYRVL